MKVAIRVLDPRLNDLAGGLLPAYETFNAAGMDLRACIDESMTIHQGQSLLIPCGFAMALPEGFVAVLAPRSGLGHKHGIVLGNLIGVVDADYRGPVMVSAWNRGDLPYTIKPMERIAQMMIVPVARVEWEIVVDLPVTVRGDGGFGSTGG